MRLRAEYQAPVGMLPCPRCGGAYWRKETIQTLRDPQPRPHDAPSVIAGHCVEGALYVHRSYSRYLCVECGFPYTKLATEGSVL